MPMFQIRIHGRGGQGGFADVSRQLHMDSVADAIMDKFSGAVGAANVAAAREAYEVASRA